MKLLILGGTRFLGRHLAEAALARGDAVTLLHRGKSATSAGAADELFPQARHLIADRNADLSVLAGSDTWDAAIDTSAYFPRQVNSIAARLAGRVGHYTLVSTISVYGDIEHPGIDESAATPCEVDPGTETVDGCTYGPLKVLCERAATSSFGEQRCAIVRPGLIVGPFDPSGRFTWWVQRIVRGGPVLAPGDPAAAVQFIDARDLAAWMLRLADAGHAGIANATGPVAPLTMGEWLGTACRVLEPSATLRWVDETRLLAAGVKPWTELPLWLAGASAALHRVSIARAVALGLRCRTLEATLADTAAWAAAGAPVVAGIGLAAEREAALLA